MEPLAANEELMYVARECGPLGLGDIGRGRAIDPSGVSRGS